MLQVRRNKSKSKNKNKNTIKIKIEPGSSSPKANQDVSMLLDRDGATTPPSPGELKDKLEQLCLEVHPNARWS